MSSTKALREHEQIERIVKKIGHETLLAKQISEGYEDKS